MIIASRVFQLVLVSFAAQVVECALLECVPVSRQLRRATSRGNSASIQDNMLWVIALLVVSNSLRAVFNLMRMK